MTAKLPAMGLTACALLAVLTQPICSPWSFATSIEARVGDPTPEEVMAKSAKAVGGRDAIAKIKNIRSVMSTNMQGMDIKMESCWSRDGGRLARTTFSMGEMVMATDGKVAWARNPMGYALLSDAERKQLNDSASIMMRILDPGTYLKDSVKSIENKGKQTFGETECWRLEYVENDGETGSMFFDAASGLPMGFETIEKQGEMEMRTQGVMSDWQDEQGIKIFRTLTITSSAQMGMAMTMKVDTLEINALPDDAFAVPDEVKKMLENQPKKEESTKDIKLEDMTAEQQQMATQALDGVKRAGDVNAQKLMLKQLESVVDITPEDQRKPLLYVIQELKKEIAKQGG